MQCLRLVGVWNAKCSFLDFQPKSNSGKAFFVFWSLLAVPSLTILISNMGDTIVKWFSDLTIWIGSITVLPEQGGMRETMQKHANAITEWLHNRSMPPGILGSISKGHEKRMDHTEYENKMLDRLSDRLKKHIDKDEKQDDQQNSSEDSDIQFFHYVLARECRNVQKDLSASPPKKYPWSDWEYYLKLMGDEKDPVDYPGQKHPDILVPEPLRAPDGLRSDGARSSDEDKFSSDESAQLASTDGNIDRQTSIKQKIEDRRKQGLRRRPKASDHNPSHLQDWSWLSNESPLMSNKSEAEWILERLSAALERELNRQRKGYKTKPPISLKDANRSRSDRAQDPEEKQKASKEQQSLAKAANSER